MKPFEDVLAAGGPLVAAWDHLDAGRTLLYLFSIDDAHATVLASTKVPLDQGESLVERLVALGVRIGGNYGSSTFVWSGDDRAFSIWSNKTATSIPHGKSVTAVTVFYDPNDVGHRGVRLVLLDGTTESVAEQHDPTPRIDPVYDDQNLEDDTRWARYLGEDLAVWLLVPLVDEIAGGTIEPVLEIARALRGLADEVAASSTEIVKSLGPIGDARELAYRCTGDTLEIEVTGTTTSTAVLKHGTRAQIAAFLRRVSTPATTVGAMNALLYRQTKL